MFRAVNRGIKKDLQKATREDIEKFITKLNKNEFLREDGKPYSGNTKSDIKKFLKQFYKWLLGESEFYPKQVSWLKTKISKDEKPKEKETLSYEEIIKLSEGFDKAEYKILVLLLFDSGFRIGELLSCKKKDLTLEDFERGKKCYWLKCNDSKTTPRKVPVPLFTDDINNFVNTAYYKNIKDDELLYPKTYNALHKAIKETAEKVLGKRISPHSLRHSSATYYSKMYDGNMNLIGERYGWSFDSKELKTYIRRSGAYQKQGVKKVYDDELTKVREELKEIRKQNKEREEELQDLSANMKLIMEMPGFEKLFKTSQKINRVENK